MRSKNSKFKNSNGFSAKSPPPSSLKSTEAILSVLFDTYGPKDFSLCSKLNAEKNLSAQVICHGVPDAYELQEGDICNIDVTVYYDGHHGDLNETYYVGEVSVRSLAS